MILKDRIRSEGAIPNLVQKSATKREPEDNARSLLRTTTGWITVTGSSALALYGIWSILYAQKDLGPAQQFQETFKGLVWITEVAIGCIGATFGSDMLRRDGKDRLTPLVTNQKKRRDGKQVIDAPKVDINV